MVRGFSERFDVGIVNFFGSNEGIAFACGPDDVSDPDQRATLFPRFGRPEVDWGKPFGRRFETKIVEIDGSGHEITQPGKAGELLIRGPNVFDGYLNDRDSECFDADGFFHTGDLFEIAGPGDMARFYRFRGRLKQLVIRGGMNISPEEVDGLISAHPKVAEAATCGYPDKVMGEKLCAFVVPKPGESITLEDITAFLDAEGVAKFKWPERLELIDSLPRNPLNKVMRGALSERLTTA